MSQQDNHDMEWLGYVGGFITTSSILPQIYKSARDGATKDLSWTMFGMFFLGISINLTFGLMIGHPAVYIAAAYGLITNFTLAAIKFYYENWPAYRDQFCSSIELQSMLSKDRI